MATTSYSTLVWNTGPLNAAILTAFRPSVYEAKAAAIASSPSRTKAKATISRLSATSIETAQATLVPTGLGWVFEKGRTPGYPIFPGGVKGFRKSAKGSVTFNTTGRAYSFRGKSKGTSKALKFSHGDGGFAANAVGGAMKAEPYINPAAQLWSRVLFPRMAARTLASRGFGVKL